MSERCTRCNGNMAREPFVGPAAADPIHADVCIHCGHTVWGPSRIDAYRQIADTVVAGQRGRPCKKRTD